MRSRSRRFSGIGLCALLCFACLLAGCKDRSEAPLSDEGSSAGSSVTYDDRTNSSTGANSSASGGAGSNNSASGSAVGSLQNSSQPAESSSAPHVHNHKLTKTVDPTCTEDGYKLFVCECGDENTTVLKAAGHNYVKKTFDADCEHDGYTRYTCSSCGDHYDEASHEHHAHGHSWGDWYVTKEATASTDGVQSRECSDCGKTETKTIPRTNDADDYVSEVIRLVNIERENYGLKPLAENKTLSDFAQLRSTEIVDNFAHERPDGSSPLKYVLGLNGIRTCGENIAWGQSTPEAVVTAWMNSPGHRANILKSDFTMIGVGCYNNNGTLYWTQIFGG